MLYIFIIHINKYQMHKNRIVEHNQKILPSLNPQQIEYSRDQKRNFSYYQALKQLKDVNKKIAIIKNRINLLASKQEQMSHPIQAYYQEREIRLRTLVTEQKQSIQEQMKKKRLKSQSEIQLKHKQNQFRKRQTKNRIELAKKIITEEKFKSHDQIKQKSLQNINKIERFKRQFFGQKQKMHDKLMIQQKNHIKNLRQIQASRIKSVRIQCQDDTRRIILRVKEKQKQLQRMLQQCKAYESNQQAVIMRHRGKLFKKMQNCRKPHTLQTFSTSQPYQYRSISPCSAMSIVIIP